MPESSRSRGDAAERFATGRLERRGYRIIDRNWRGRGGEIDIIAMDGDILVFVEVRQRTGSNFGTAEASVDYRKLERIMDTADEYLQANPDYADLIWRVDILAITLDRRGVVRRIEHIENVTND